MHETIAGHGRPCGRRVAGVMALAYALLAGPLAGGCGSSTPPPGTETHAGGRRQQMVNFMKTQKPAASAGTRVRRHP